MNDGKVSDWSCTERIEQGVYFAEKAGSHGSCNQYMEGINDNGEDYLEECMKNKCIETADYHALQCQCEGPMKNIEIPINCDDMIDPRDAPTANLNAFGLPSSTGAIVGHMAFALISERVDDNFTANWTIAGTGITLQVKPGMIIQNEISVTFTKWIS